MDMKVKELKVVKRNKEAVEFDGDKIRIAIENAFLDANGYKDNPPLDENNILSVERIHALSEEATDAVISILLHRHNNSDRIVTPVNIEDIQDLVEGALMQAGHQKVARAYVIYRDKHAQLRKGNAVSEEKDVPVVIDGKQISSLQYLRQTLQYACQGLEHIKFDKVIESSSRMLFKGMTQGQLDDQLLLDVRTFIEAEPNHTYVAAQLLNNMLRREAFAALGLSDCPDSPESMTDAAAAYFKAYINKGIEVELLDSSLKTFDLDVLADAMVFERDRQFAYLGIKTLYDRYLLHWDGQRFELPQALFMRVAMGLALNEPPESRNQRAIEFYTVMSSFDYMTSTPTLFNSGTTRPQLSSCFISTIGDDLDSIYQHGITGNAHMQKWAGGVGNDWTRVRAQGALIKGTNGKSLGVIPFMKVANDTALAVNQGGKRPGSVCAYLETWHLDIEDFLDLRKNTGDDRRRTHDMNTANWVPDLFMKRVRDRGMWTLFSPNDVPELHDLYGKAFEEKYCAYEAKAEAGEIALFKRVDAFGLWQKMLQMLFETGHPWVTFKDPCNIRSPQQHVGTVHSSNLCTEITLNTSDDEIAVCNLGSVNLAAHITKADGLDFNKLEKTVTTAMRMLDNVIDINYYAVDKARDSNLKHRPVGLGLMGFQDALQTLSAPYESEAALLFADAAMEAISYYAIRASVELAKERDAYPSFEGSLWSKGVLPIDSIRLLEDERDGMCKMDITQRLDWADLRKAVVAYGMRNSNCMAIAPTATISNIVGVAQSIEPTYQNLYVKSNLSGEFIYVNQILVEALRERGLWDAAMAADIKALDGRLSSITRIPDDIKAVFKTAFEIDPIALVNCASRRQKWIDQAQSLNIYMAEPSGKLLDNIYQHAWEMGLKTTYYLRSLAGTEQEKLANPQPVQPDAMVCNMEDGCDVCQ